jgi:hypothetical protein
MLQTANVLLTILFLAGSCIVVASFAVFNLRTRASMRIANQAKRQTIRWVAVGSACVGLAFAIMAFLATRQDREMPVSCFGQIALALGLGIGLSVLLFAGVLLNIYWLKHVTIPDLRRRSSADTQEEEETRE